MGWHVLNVTLLFCAHTGRRWDLPYWNELLFTNPLSKEASRNHIVGIIEVALSGVCFGFLGVFGKWAYERGIRPAELLGFRFLTAAVLMGVGFKLFAPARLKISRKDFQMSVVLGMVSALFAGLFFATLQHLSVSLSVLLFYSYPLFVFLGSNFILRNAIQWRGWLILLLCFLGLALLLWGDLRIENQFGLALGLCSAAGYSVYILVSGQYLKSAASIWSLSFYILLISGLILTAAGFESIERWIEVWSKGWWILLSLALLCSVAAVTLFLSGLRKVTSAEASILSTTEPMTGVLLAAAFLGERLTLLQALGGLFLLISLALTSVSRKK